MPARTLTIAVDLDGVLCDVIEPLRPTLARLRRCPVTRADVAAVLRAHDDEYQRLYDRYVADGAMAAAPVLDGARHALARLSGRHRVLVVTARGMQPSRRTLERAATCDWLTVHELAHDGLYFADDKASVAFDVLVDDQPFNVEQARAAGRHGLLFDAPYNDHVDLPRVHGWADAVAQIERIAAG